MSIEYIPDWMKELEDKDVNFIKKFILASGSLKEIAKQYDVSYPTVRLRINKIIGKIEIAEKKEEDSYIKLVKTLALNNQLDYATAKMLIKEYNKRGK